MARGPWLVSKTQSACNGFGIRYLRECAVQRIARGLVGVQAVGGMRYIRSPVAEYLNTGIARPSLLRTKMLIIRQWGGGAGQNGLLWATGWQSEALV